MFRRISVVGIGDDGRAGLSASALAAVRSAEVLAGGERHLAMFPEHPAERVAFRGGLAAALDAVEAAARHRRVVVLASGDPGFFGIVPALARRFGADALAVLPAPGSVSLAFARLGLGWQSARVLSAHGRPLDSILPAAQSARTMAILTDETNTPAAVAGALLSTGVEDAPAHVFERLGGPAERHTPTTLAALAESPAVFDPLNLLVVLRDSVPRRRLSPGRPDAWFAHRRGQITKAEVRAVSLGYLALRDGDAVWDVGAGCGSVSVEAAALVGERGAVHAVERDTEQLGFLAENRRRFPSPTVRVVAGEAPAALEALPDPDAVFIGGSGGHLAAIMAVVRARLRPGGRCVLNLATLEHLAEARTALAGWPGGVAQVSVSRSADIAGLTRLAALNPVFVVHAERPEVPA